MEHPHSRILWSLVVWWNVKWYIMLKNMLSLRNEMEKKGVEQLRD